MLEEICRCSVFFSRPFDALELPKDVATPVQAECRSVIRAEGLVLDLLFGLLIDRGHIERAHMFSRHAPIAFVAGLPRRKPEPLAHVCLAIAPIITGM